VTGRETSWRQAVAQVAGRHRHVKLIIGTLRGDRLLRLAMIRTVNPDFRGRGLASAALADLCQVADEHGVTIYLTPCPTGRRRLSARQLDLWYRRHGWVPVPRRQRDGEFSDTMIRRPGGGGS